MNWGSSSHTIAATPEVDTTGMKLWPSTLTPRTATNSAPASTRRESGVSIVISLSMGPMSSLGAMAVMSCESFFILRVRWFGSVC